MKAYTDIEQSKKLAEILPPESADMAYIASATDDDGETLYTAEYKSEIIIYEADDYVNCWSLTALLNVINKTYYVTLLHDGIMWNILVIHHDIDKCNHTIHADNPVDACVDMIGKLNELKML